MESPQQQNELVPTTELNQLAEKILSSPDSKGIFDAYVSKNKDAQNAMNIINEYGNGDPKTAFMNYMVSKGKEELGKQILSRLGLN